ncbi:N-acetylglucosamine-6-phosphate deacetylase [Chitinophagaceae bacterium IBVUCB2]|nr:N-acetylglucosamine-6-phosphate deacetylase [Chitinophagaceae bacterium IBVUCB2]
MATTKIYIADKIFTGETWLQNHAVIVEKHIIKEVLPVSSLSADQQAEKFSNCFLTPSFIDLQIYGAGGKLLSAHPKPASLQLLQEHNAKGGTIFCLPTAATNTYEVFFKCIDAVREYWKNNGSGILGLHLEGPWINAGKRGAHIESLVHSPSVQQVQDLLNYGKDVIKMITLAPEIVSKEIIDIIKSSGIIISAGHSNATYSEAKESFTNGITAVTHLYNAMSPLQHRQPGLVGAAMNDATVMASIIPDGYHVDYAAMRIAKQVMKERLFVITDAVTDTIEGEYQHQAAGDKYEANNILSGSALTMAKAVQNLVNFAGIELGEALRMCSLYPARLVGLSDYGKIEKGYSSSILVMNEKMEVIRLL